MFHKFTALALLTATSSLGAVACVATTDPGAKETTDESSQAMLGGIATTGTTSTTSPAGAAASIFALSGITFDAATGTVTIFGTSGNDLATVGVVGVNVSVSLNATTQTYAAASVKGIVFYGGNGDDSFTNATSVNTTAHGGAGNDVLIGGAGNDVLYGDAGNDNLHGGAGRDTIFGGPGNDQLFGDSGQDLLVTVGGGIDTITGGAQWDNVWMDDLDIFTDASFNEILFGYVHKVGSFQPISYNGGTSTTPIGLEPAGEDLPDPLPNFALSTSVTNFASSPLFPVGGPTKDDIFQGSVGDCYLMSALASLADAESEYIRKMVAPLGDGTFAVRFYDAGAPVYVRVDADLWVNGGGAPIYAKRGAENAIWVPIIEKAYAFFRRDDGAYSSIASGDGNLAGQLNAGGPTYTTNDGLTAQNIIDWTNAGSPAGFTKDTVAQGVYMMLTWINTQRAAGKPVTVGSMANVSDTTPLQVDDPSTPATNESTWRRGQHIFMVDHVNVDAGGTPTALVLRNPYGSYVTLTDTTRIYFCIGGAAVVDAK